MRPNTRQAGVAAFPCSIVRGGTSKAVVVRENTLPSGDSARRSTILSIMGAPDIRQIDGLGGADATTSKFAIVGPPSVSNADVDYTFIQVGIRNATLDFGGNCGNISAAIGPYAIEEGLVASTDDTSIVRIHNTNTSKILIAHVPTSDGQTLVDGDISIAGVPGTGAPVFLDYSETAGTLYGTVYPTGNPIDSLVVAGHGEIEVSLIDVANPVIYVRASDVGLKGAETVAELESDVGLMSRLEAIRSHAAVVLGMTDAPEKATLECPLFPLLSVVAEPQSYEAYGGGSIDRSAYDIAVRMLTAQQIHRAYAGTGTANLGAAAMMEGTIAYEAAAPGARRRGEIRFGHPSGIAAVEAAVGVEDGEVYVKRAGYVRTARRLLDGIVYVRRSVIGSASD